MQNTSINAVRRKRNCCGAKTRRGTACRGLAMKNGRCRMHGGTNPGAPKGNQNALKHGMYSRKAREENERLKQLMQGWRESNK